MPGIDLSHPYETTNVRVDELDEFTARSVEGGIGAGSLDEAERTVRRLADQPDAHDRDGRRLTWPSSRVPSCSSSTAVDAGPSCSC